MNADYFKIGAACLDALIVSRMVGWNVLRCHDRVMRRRGEGREDSAQRGVVVVRVREEERLGMQVRWKLVILQIG